MDLQVNMDKVMEIMKERLAAVSHENIMLQAVVQSQQEELVRLREAVDSFSKDKEEGSGSEG